MPLEESFRDHTRMRDSEDLTAFARWGAGENRPQGVAVGAIKSIPQGTEVRVVDVKLAGTFKATNVIV